MTGLIAYLSWSRSTAAEARIQRGLVHDPVTRVSSSMS